MPDIQPKRCGNCDTPMNTWHTITIGVVDFDLCQRCDEQTMRNGAARASFYRKRLEQAESALAAAVAQNERLEREISFLVAVGEEHGVSLTREWIERLSHVLTLPQEAPSDG